MPVVDVLVKTPVERTFRAEQVAGMFDLPLEGVSESRFMVEVPGLDEEWRIGLVTGPSGSGKSTVARQAFAGMIAETREWPRERGVIDGFGDAGIEQITRALGAVGFNTPPAWLRPYAVLSNGEKFRCELARALVTRRPCVVFDEFTSLVDRQVARVTSAAVSRAVRDGKLGGAQRFVAVTCHADVAEWLEPDWVVDMAAGSLARRRLRRPSVRLEVYRAGRQAWRVFGKHHYLTGMLPPTAECYVATWEGREVSLCAMVRAVGRGLSGWRVSRLVTLPDYQGLGIGPRLAACVAGLYARHGERVRITTSHPAMARALGSRGEWKLVRCKRPGGVSARRLDGDTMERSRSGRRWTATWEWGGG